jgi:hypothetical protein
MIVRPAVSMFRVTMWVRCSILLLCAASACTDVSAPSGGGSTTTTSVVITPGQVRLVAVGDTVRLRAAMYDDGGTRLTNAGVTWSSADPDVFTIDQSGLVTGLKALSVGRAIATASGKADTAYVVVANPDASPCLGSGLPIALSIGQAISVSMSDGACITSAGGSDEYVVVPWFGTTSGAATIPLEVTGVGLSDLAPTPARLPVAYRSSYAAAEGGSASASSLRRSLAFDRRLREQGVRAIMPLAPKARAEFARRALDPSLASVPGYLTIGDLVQLNTNPDACTATTIRTGRVVAVSARAIVVADTGNPAGGFTDADYARFAAGYDTLIAPVEDANFGTPTDIDANGKVVIFFTRAVNELSPSDGSGYVAGYFNPRDLLPRYFSGQAYCLSSNEREMFYMPVPDPDGVVNGNKMSFGLIDSITMGALAHENQHLVNFGRRLYVNNALTDEAPWLNEGLSDIAEELVFYHAAGLTPRQNIGSERFGAQPFDGLFRMYMAPNFARLSVFLGAPQSYSPYSSNYDAGTSGATWAFLRYAADHSASAESDLWLRLTNSSVSGFDNLFDVLGVNLGDMLDGWAVSVYTDDDTQGVDAMYTQPSWNFRSAFPAQPTAAQPYPLLGAIGVLSDNVPATVSLRGGGSAYLRFSVVAGKEAAIRLTSGGWMPSSAMWATIVRTR